MSLCLCLLLMTCAGCARKGEKSPAPRPAEGRASRQNSAPVYLALGDSTGIGVGARDGGYVDRLMRRIALLRPGAKLVNLCAAGATTANVLRKQIERINESQATLVTVGVGINDLTRGVPEKEFAENYDAIVSRLGDSGATVILMNLPNLTAVPAMAGLPHDELDRRVEGYNKQIAEIASRHNLLLFDLHQVSTDSARSHPEFISADGFHPSDAGYEFWTEAMWPMVKKAIEESN